ncbi:MAG: alpha/beta fold hydrolase [Saprospiraceae bacterium]|nr:alpha/beta fold hydrolase [Saprospiraceae bacterium]
MLTVLYIILAIIFCWFLGNLFTYPLQDYFIFRPKKLQSTYQFSFPPEAEEIFLETPHHGKINALHFRASSNAKGVVLYFHGNADNLARWGHLHLFFAQFNYDYFVYDYRGFGKSKGPRNEQIMYEDASAIFAYLTKHYSLDQIVIFGRSMGSAFACKIAAENRVKALILETPFSSMKNLFYTYYPFLPKIFIFKYRFPNKKYLTEVQCPVHIFQGTKDWVVPYTCAARLKSCLKINDTFITIPEGKHNNLISFDIYSQKIEAILKE